MPRPGPRPYECVRRTWHSDRHQPMRGSFIQEIFRITAETHSPSTKANKEWQEKLPIVVLKAEEIIYSKANSEADYMDPNTLFERVNDAIDTIIKRDESTETGLFLQPCIEAALNLGCIARRASRSQRNSDPSFYLGPYSLGTSNRNSSTDTSNMGEEGCISMPTSPSPIPFQYSNFLKTSSAAYPDKVPSKSVEFPVSNGSYLPSTTFSSYPLYYGSLPSSTPAKPVRDSTKEHVEMGIAGNSCCRELSSKNLVIITEKEDKPPSKFLSGPPELAVCDLVLRLAPLSVSTCESHYWSRENSKDACGGATPVDGNALPTEMNKKFGDLSLVKKRCQEFQLLSLGNFVSTSSNDSSPLGIRKRRAVEPAEGDSQLWKQKHSFFAPSLPQGGAKA